jgi:hypothetical protein
MPALFPCPDCGHEVSKKAEACPSCGRKLKSKSSGAALLLIILLAFILYFIAMGLFR